MSHLLLHRSSFPPREAAPAWGGDSIVDLQQGWRPEEIDLCHHTSEGTNLAPLELALPLPDLKRPGHRRLRGFRSHRSHSVGRGPAAHAALAREDDSGPNPACWSSSPEGIFASSPYLHNGAVRTLWDLLTRHPSSSQGCDYGTSSPGTEARPAQITAAAALLHGAAT